MTAWLNRARDFIGQKEVAGSASNEWIVWMWASLPGGAWYWNAYGKDDSKLPWCGAFCAFVMRDRGLTFPRKYASAREWAVWGTKLQAPAPGAVAVFQRAGGGHVGFVVGKDAKGRLLVLGGNQADSVSVAAFDPARVIAYRWPAGVPAPESLTLPTYAHAGLTSRNEA